MNTDTATELDLLAQAHGMELRLERDEKAPKLFAVWGWSPDDETEDDRDIIGAGDTETEAINDARETMRSWSAVTP
jgi:hypothetical protein